MPSVAKVDICGMSTGELAVYNARKLVERGVEYVYLCEDCVPLEKMNCPVVVWWVFTCCSVKMPKVSRQLFRDLLYLGKPVASDELQAGHLIFTAGCRQECLDDDRAKRGVGHVGIATDDNSAIHASYYQGKVVEEPLSSFFDEGNHFRGCYSVH